MPANHYRFQEEWFIPAEVARSIADGHGKLKLGGERRAITVEDWPAASVVVLSGIVAGDLIVLDPTAAVAGARVRIEVRDGV